MQYRQAISILAAAALLAMTLTGCAGPFEKEYSYSAPFTYSAGAESGGGTEVRNYNMLKAALTDLMNNHREQGSFRFSSYNGSVPDDLAAACLEVRTVNPLGAYAVESMTYDTSRIISYYVAEVSVVYKRSAEEIRAIRGVASLAELENRMREAVLGFQTGLVLRIYSAQVNESYLEELAQQIYLSDPAALTAEPLLHIRAYPSEGINRIYELSIQYGRHPAHLKAMAGELSRQLHAITEPISGESGAQTALQCAEALWDRAGGAGGEGESAYDALVRRNADSKGISLAFKALCDALEVECICVQGAMRSQGTQDHWWNMLCLDGAWYHADVSRFGGDRSAVFLMDDAGFWSDYLWDGERYPVCDGTLRYADLVPPASEAAASENGWDGGAAEHPEPVGPPPFTEPPQPAETPVRPPAETQPLPSEAESPAPAESPGPAESSGPAESPAPAESYAPAESPFPPESPVPPEAPAETKPPQPSEPVQPEKP